MAICTNTRIGKWQMVSQALDSLPNPAHGQHAPEGTDRNQRKLFYSYNIKTA